MHDPVLGRFHDFGSDPADKNEVFAIGGDIEGLGGDGRYRVGRGPDREEGAWRPEQDPFDEADVAVFERFVESLRFLKPSFYETL